MNRPVVVVGPGARFLSGVSYYTAALVKALHHHGSGSSGLLIDRLCPAFIYPGRHRIGIHPETVLDHGDAPVRRHLQWFWGPQIVAAVWFLIRQRPSVLLLQFWTGTTAHTYLLLAVVARLRKTRVVIEFHEVLDVSETAIGPVRNYVKTVMALLLHVTDAVVVHSKQDVAAVQSFYPAARRRPYGVIPHGPLNHLQVRPVAGADATRFTFFGVMRDYKGLPELVSAFRALRARGVPATLTLAGEPWDEMRNLVESLQDTPDVELRLGHLPDSELAEVLAHTDVVVLPYRRSSASGPLHTATALGLPVVTTNLPSLVDAVAGYRGVLFAEPCDVESLTNAMGDSITMVGTVFEDPNSWETTVARYQVMFDSIGVH